MKNFKETKQKKPCIGCPFKKNNIPCSTDTDASMPGGSHPFVYIGQARGPFWLPCHMDKNYKGKGSDPATVSQCRGAAIFRSNCGKPYKLPEPLLDLPRDTENVFEDESAFIKHYLGDEFDDNEIFKLTNKQMLDKMMMHEMNKKSETKRYY